MAVPLTNHPANVQNWLLSAYGGDWDVTQNPHLDALDIRFRCAARGFFSVSRAALEDTTHPAELLFETTNRMYNGAHRRPFPNEAERLVACSRCSRLNAVPDIEQLDANAQFEYAERMAVLWMERAASIRRLWST